jgi:hypothetical protein
MAGDCPADSILGAMCAGWAINQCRSMETYRHRATLTIHGSFVPQSVPEMTYAFHDSPPPSLNDGILQPLSVVWYNTRWHEPFFKRDIYPWLWLGNLVEQIVLGSGLGSLLDTRPARELPRKEAFLKRGSSRVASDVCSCGPLERKRHVSVRSSKQRPWSGAFRREDVPRQKYIEEQRRRAGAKTMDTMQTTQKISLDACRS